MFNRDHRKLYLSRIRMEVEPPSIEYLTRLQRNHLCHIPFENLDIHIGIRKTLEMAKTFDKIINSSNRGGYCFELNGLFYHLLESLGFQCYLTSARFFEEKKQAYSMPLDHMMIVVELKDVSYLVDVGNINGTTIPKPIVPQVVTLDCATYFKFETDVDGAFILMRSSDQANFNIYLKTLLENRRTIEFLTANDRHQDSEESFFRKNIVVSKLKKGGGRILLTDKKLETESLGKKEEVAIQDKTEFYALLEQYFQISRDQLVKQTLG